MQIITIRTHSSQYPDPIHFLPNDSLILGERDTEYAGWIWVKTPSGNEGWAPISFIEIISESSGIGKESYSAKELNTVAGEMLIGHKELDEWLWVENERGECGWIPKKTTSVP